MYRDDFDLEFSHFSGCCHRFSESDHIGRPVFETTEPHDTNHEW
ncbi:hypothetical protein VN12_25400 [Pirellula sp. SH-Sr6A]|nr:hypothetical protein VN12_25400 [Pirellula sp. SH-Sr6A]